MIQNTLKALFTVAFACLAWTAGAQLGGNSTYAFLNVTPAARVGALAQAGIASVDNDIQFAWLNPALLREEHRNQIGLSYLSIPGGVNAAEATYGFGRREGRNWMVGFRYMDYGSFNGTDVAGNPTGTFRASDQLLNVGYSYRLDSNWQFGASARLISSVYEQYTSFGTAIDLGAVYQIPSSRLAIAFIARNAGFQLTSYAGERESLPFELQMAISNRFEHLPLRWTLQIENLQRWDLTYFDPNAVTRDPVTGDETYDEPTFGQNLLRHFSASADLNLGRSINLQLGYSFRHAAEMRVPTIRTSAGLTFGLGLKFAKFRLNYGNRYVHIAGRMHHLSILVDLEDFGS